MIKLPTQASYDGNVKPLEEQSASLKSAFTSLAIAMSKLVEPRLMSDYIQALSIDLIEKIREIFGDGIKGYEAWASFGWSFSPSVDYVLFKNAPASLEDANNIMEKYLTEKEIDDIMYALEVAGANVEELEEAFNCYAQGMYKSCALLLFGIIDNKTYSYGLLRGGKTLTGSSFAKEQIKRKRYDDFTLQGVLVNTLLAINKMFDFGNDFKDEMAIINRNYLAHGMARRNITKLECFQVWCLAYSTWVLLDVIEECSDTDTAV